MIAVVLATGVAFLSEYKSDREFEMLNAAKDSVRVKVLRDGGGPHRRRSKRSSSATSSSWRWATRSPPTAGSSRRPSCYIDQSLMTGESEPVQEDRRPATTTADGPDQPGCVYRGTQVVDGVGQMVVTDVGDDTMLGQIARRLSGEPDEATSEAGGEPPPNRARSASSTS